MAHDTHFMLRDHLLKIKDFACSFLIRNCAATLANYLLEKTDFSLWESYGVHVLPVHFYNPIPDTRTLSEDLWNRRTDMVGMDMNDSYAIELLQGVFPQYRHEFAFPLDRTDDPHAFYLHNGVFLSFDPEVYHCMIRHFKPRRIIEIGSGLTTMLAACSCRMNWEKDGALTDLYAVEPYPQPFLRQGFPGLTQLLPKKLEDVEHSFFQQLEPNDFLFIDSTHVVRTGGDVVSLFLEIIPRLKPGVLVHIHDIYMPAEYPRRWYFKERWFWSEQYLLQAFLCFNHSFEVIWGSSFMHLNHPDECRAMFPNYPDIRLSNQTTSPNHPDFPLFGLTPSSFWIRRKE